MSPLGKGLLASALTLPLVAFVAGVLAAPDPVDPDRSRPVIIGRVSEDTPTDKPSQPPVPDERRGDGDRDPGRDDEDDEDDRTTGSPGTVVIPQPRDVDGDDDDRDDDDDDGDRDDGEDDTDERESDDD